MFRKSIPFAFMLIILVTACSPSTSAVTPVPIVELRVEINPSAVPTLVPTSVSAAVPKQRDLIFIEFFAVT